MKLSGWRGAPAGAADPSADARARRIRRAAAALCALALPLAGATDATAATQVTKPNTGNLTAVGPVNALNGFPAWYQDSKGLRVEPCLDKDNALCGFLPGDVPDPTRPISFPANFPEEFFYQVVGAGITNGAFKATLTIGLEGAFANGAAVQGDQQVFARTRIVVKGAPTTLTAPLHFVTPFGEADVDIDATGAGKLVEDKTPAIGNFATPLAGNFGPFLTSTAGTIKDSTGEYLGDPNVAGTVTGSPFGTNVFSVSGGVTGTTDQFTISGKVATNTGVQADAASATADGRFVDVFATSTGEQLQVEPSGAATPLTPMLHDPKSDRFYARLPVTGALPAEVTVTNIADKPASQSKVAVRTPTGLSISRAEFSGKDNTLTVSASSATPGDALTVTGYGPLTAGTATFGTVSPPATVEVTAGSGTGARKVTAPVTITDGVVTPAQPSIPPQQPPGGGTTVPAPTGLRATPGATNVALTWAAVTGATKYQVTAYAADGTTRLTPQPVSTAATLQNVVGLAAGTSYQFTVTATTGAGTSAESPKVTAKTATETVAITSARWKATDFRVQGTSSAAGGTVSVYTANPGTGPTPVGTPIAGMANVALTAGVPPATGSAFDARLRTGVPARPAQVWVRTNNGAVAGPFTVT